MMKKKIYLIALIFIALLGLKACINKDTPDAAKITTVREIEEPILYPADAKTVVINGIDYLQSQAGVGKYGGDFVTSTIGEGPKTFNPMNTKDATSAQMTDLLYDGLLTSHPMSGKIIPKLAKSFEILPDKKTYIIHLRHGIKWSDGKPITADDVIFTWKDIILAGIGNTSTRDSLVIDGKLPSVEKIGNYTVKFTTIKPFAPFLSNLSSSIVPKHIFEPAVKKGAGSFEGFQSTNTKPSEFVTSGAFKLKEYVPAQRVVFERNPNYYMIDKSNKKLPYLDKVIYLIVGDLNNEILKFEAKELDVVALRGSNVARFKQKEKASDYKIYNAGPATSTMFVSINMNNRKDKQGKFYVNPIKQYWFHDLNFRSAIDFAIDRENMVFNIANGLAEPLFTAETLNSIFLNANIKGHKKDLTISKDFLKKSGFYWNKKGELLDKFDNRVEFDLYTNAGNTEREAIGVMLKQDLEELGMKVNFKPIEFNSLVNKLVNTPDYDLVIMGLTGSPLEPNGGKNVWMSNGTLHLFNQRKLKTQKDDRFGFEKKLDELFSKGALELDFEKRKAIYEQYQQVVYDAKPILYLYSPIRIIAIRKKFQNIYPSAIQAIGYNIEELWIK